MAPHMTHFRMRAKRGERQKIIDHVDIWQRDRRHQAAGAQAPFTRRTGRRTRAEDVETIVRVSAELGAELAGKSPRG